jgi:hypothetical protein
VEDLLGQYDLATEGNGHGEELSFDQIEMILELHDRVAPLKAKLHPDDDFLDHECCRRYLVARQWSLERAEAQLTGTLEWRAKESSNLMREMWQSPACLKDPLAMNLRVVGWTADGRPVGFSCFRESHHRYDPEENIEHVLFVLEAMQKLVKERRKLGLNKTAASRQFVWVIDFDGFGFRDMNPRTGILAARLMANFPEFLNQLVLVDAPRSYNSLYQMASALMDDRVRNKVLFVKRTQAEELLQDRLGHEAAEWIAHETKDNREKYADTKLGAPSKQYWKVPADPFQHDPRGMGHYVHSELYIKTPGDAYEEIKKGLDPSQKKRKHQVEHKEQTRREEHHVITMPVFAQSLYRGYY